jgi:predicted Fe-Mo cluster-binding NifX family protein
VLPKGKIMKIAITALEANLASPVEPRFGRAKQFVLFDTETEEFQVIDNLQNLNAAQGAGIQSAQNIINAGAEVLISGHCGPKAFRVLSTGKVKIYVNASGTIQENLDRLRAGTLEEAANADVEGHWV